MHRAAAVLAMLILAGCADPGIQFRTSASEPAPPGDGGPYGGDGTVHLVAVYFSFEFDAESASGDMGGHCAFDEWTMDPPSARMDVPSDAAVPEAVVMREVHPDEDDLDRVGHFGTAPVAHWEGHWDGTTLTAAFDRGRELGTVTWDDGGARFEGVRIPTGHWLLADFAYASTEGERTMHVEETLHLRDLGEAPASFDRSDPMCA